MTQSIIQQTAPPPPKTWLTILQFLLPVILAIVAGYGAVQYASGETQAKINELDRRLKEQSDNLNRTADRMITRDEMRQFIEATRDDLREIKNDIRALRR
jgi:sensor c-di-GMP phosphodiesterase-like protein